MCAWDLRESVSLHASALSQSLRIATGVRPPTYCTDSIVIGADHHCCRVVRAPLSLRVSESASLWNHGRSVLLCRPRSCASTRLRLSRRLGVTAMAATAAGCLQLAVAMATVWARRRRRRDQHQGQGQGQGRRTRLADHSKLYPWTIAD